MLFSLFLCLFYLPSFPPTHPSIHPSTTQSTRVNGSRIGMANFLMNSKKSLQKVVSYSQVSIYLVMYGNGWMNRWTDGELILSGPSNHPFHPSIHPSIHPSHAHTSIHLYIHPYPIYLSIGTPIQNSLEELWTLLNFCQPDIFDNLDIFRGWFGFQNIGM